MAESPELKRSVQSRPGKDGGGAPVTDILTDWLEVMSESNEAPKYWSRRRDQWLRDFCRLPGNDLLAGTIATVAAKVATTGWFLEGPERTANLYRDKVMGNADFGHGWSNMVSKVVEDYLTQDAGGWIERIRTGRQGAAIGLASLDNAQMYIKGNPDWPAAFAPYWNNDSQDQIPMHRSQVIHLVDMPSPEMKLLDVGFCAVSRALTTAQILMDVVGYERERLSDLPPAGLLLLNNMAKNQWEDVTKRYDTRQQQRGNKTWRNIMTLFGLDPSLPLSAELFSFSSLPEAFDKRTQTEISIYSFALAFRVDPREIWPVSAGPLGTATEANIQHIKARAKGAGLLLTEIERAMNDGYTLPPSLVFGFDFQDAEEDEQSARIAQMKAEYIRTLAEPFAARGGVVEEAAIISREEARSWLVKEGLFDEEELMTIDDTGRATDVEEAKSAYALDMGPRVRAYSNGRTVRLERPRRVYKGWDNPRAAMQALEEAYFHAMAMEAGSVQDAG